MAITGKGISENFFKFFNQKLKRDAAPFRYRLLFPGVSQKPYNEPRENGKLLPFLKKCGSVISLVLSNLVPVFGVLFWDWDIFSLFLIFWGESAVIGFINIWKMIVVAALVRKKGEETENATSKSTSDPVFAIVFFTLHFGMFTMGYLLVLIMLFNPESTGDIPSSLTYFSSILPSLYPASLSFFKSHFFLLYQFPREKGIHPL